ncbi:MAG: hypothetical protein IJL20_06075 [Lachnospiraceae bacterium]|nr:hypothetical protein [Lachnospiraceae bacterium]
MFSINFKIINSEFDDFCGQNGFLSLNFNDYQYGEIYSDALNDIMDKVSIYNWIERLLKIFNVLYSKNHVFLSDVDSYNSWIYFEKKDFYLTVKILRCEKKPNTKDIVFSLEEDSVEEDATQVVKWKDFSSQLLSKTDEYINYICANNSDSYKFKDLIELHQIALNHLYM